MESMESIKTENFKYQIQELVGDEYVVCSPYVSSTTAITLCHVSCGYKWEAKPCNFLRNQSCPNCQKKSRRKSPEQFAQEVYEMVQEEYLILTPYVKGRERVWI